MHETEGWCQILLIVFPPELKHDNRLPDVVLVEVVVVLAERIVTWCKSTLRCFDLFERAHLKEALPNPEADKKMELENGK